MCFREAARLPPQPLHSRRFVSGIPPMIAFSLVPFTGIALQLLFQTPQVPRRSTRRRVRDNKTKKWAERSVWTMVCAVELGLIEPPTITSFARKLNKTRTKKPKWSEKRSTSKGCAPKTSDSKAVGSKFSKIGRKINPWFDYGQPDEKINRNEYSQGPLLEHRYSLPPDNLNATKVRNIYYNKGRRPTAGKNTVYNPFNALRDWSKKSNCGINNQSERSRTKGFSSGDRDAEGPRNFKRKRIFTKHTKNSTLKERLKYGNNSKTIRSVRRIPPKRAHFRRKQEDSACLEVNRRARVTVEISREETSTEQTEVPSTSVSQDSSESDTYEFNRGLKNQTSIHSASSSAEDSSETDGQGSQDFLQKGRSIDTINWNKLYTDTDKRVETAAEKHRSPCREPVWSLANKEDQNVNEKIVQEQISTTSTRSEMKSSSEDVMILVADPSIDYEDSDFDEELLVNPSTDLPGALFESDDQDNEIIDLNPEFDVNFHMNFDVHSKDVEKMGTSIEMEFWGDDKKEERHNQSSCKSYWGKTNVLNDGMKIKRRSRRRSSSSSSSGQDKENCKANNINNAVGRITRGSVRNCAAKESNEKSWAIGTVVWGKCMGWWPGLIVGADDVGMTCSEGKSWIFWIGEHRISHLRDKTQVQSLSAGLRAHMIETLRVKTPKDANYAACLATIKLLNEEILQRGPLTKPYHAWVERHLASHKNIDRLMVYPYPPHVQERLDKLKEVNSEVTEKYLSEVNESSERTATTTTTKSSSSSNAKTGVYTDPGHLPLANQKPGVITWAKIMGQIWWPAVIIDFRDCGMKEPNFGCQWILWYGDFTLSQVNHRFFLAFEIGIQRMKEYVLNCKREVYRRGVVEAAKDYCSQYGYRTDAWTIEDVFEWFSRLDDDEDSTSDFRRNALPGITGNSGELSQKYPSRIVEGLRKHKGNCTIARIREHNIKDSDALKSVMLGKSRLKSLCLVCLNNCCNIFDNTSTDHPFFEGALCEECLEKYTPTIFAYGDDGKCFFCTVCAGSDTVVMCDEHDCPRVYCTACLKYLIAPKTYDEIMLNDPFICFLCQDSPELLVDGLLKPRADWNTRVSGLFHGNRDALPSQVEYYKDGKKKLRVLSLFDGISSGLVVLNKLGIHVEAYYASEIDPDAEMVSSAHFGQQIIRLGDVRSITEEKVREIAPIHLLIGGSPCNDLSLVNPMRLGLHDPNGTGILVFEYCRVRNLIEKANADAHFFWLFENVASMPSKYRLEINEHLGREPELIDAANYSPQHRPRLYWSNFPIVSYPLPSQDLQDVLTPNCNRHALVKKIRTVTTRVNSLKQGKLSLKPILMNEENDTLWITELEEIFGFPRHYTDVKNLCATKRQKLIGMSWSIQTITELMRPLCNFFEPRNQHTSPKL